MSVDYSLFLNWCREYFNDDLVFTKGGNEILAPSPFAEDFKHHLSMNPSGGKAKHRPEDGSYRCFKSGKQGTLVSLVSQLEGIDWEEAQELICEQVSFRVLEQRVNELFGHKETKPEIKQSNIGLINLPSYTYLISSLTPGEPYDIQSREYLEKRKIPTENMYVCTSGKYADRIVIPYYDQNRNLVWWNARTMSNNPKVIKYLKPEVEADSGLSQDNVLFVRTWPKKNNRLFIMEGEFDAISLDLCGFRSAACGGKTLSPNQIDMIRSYVPVLAFDTDHPVDWGKKALIETGTTLLQKGFPEVLYVRAPKAYKDWNKFLIQKDKEVVKQYVEKYTKRFTSWTAEQLEMNEI